METDRDTHTHTHNEDLYSTWDTVVGLLGKKEVLACKLSDWRVLSDIHTGTHNTLAVDKEREAERQVCAGGR